MYGGKGTCPCSFITFSSSTGVASKRRTRAPSGLICSTCVLMPAISSSRPTGNALPGRTQASHRAFPASSGKRVCTSRISTCPPCSVRPKRRAGITFVLLTTMQSPGRKNSTIRGAGTISNRPFPSLGQCKICVFPFPGERLAINSLGKSKA